VNPNRFMVFGLQSSGKTTFAAALWHLLDSGEVPTALLKGKHVGDFRYLEEIAKNWCEGWRVERTGTQRVEEIKINLLHPTSGTELLLEFADLSGEALEVAFARRLCAPTFVELIKDASGILLFVSADRIVDDVTILDALAGENMEDDPEDAEDEAGENADRDGGASRAEDPPWDATKTPHQVQLVDLLEALRVSPFGKLPFKVAVIVSAWDLTVETSAEKWLAKKLPLLDQYLRHGGDTLDVRVYGVSAQGGQLSKRGEKPGADRDRLLSLVPSKRIKIVGQDVAEHDLTSPLLWLSGLDEKA
jgi:hypothetical protein